MIQGPAKSTQREEPSQPPTASLVLEWVWPAPRRQILAGSRLRIGRDITSEIQLEGTGVSRQHAELDRQGPLDVVRDVGSTNGTWLDGQRVQHALVQPGMVLRVGEWLGVFALRTEGSPPFAELAPGLFGGPELADVLRVLQRASSAQLPVVLVGDIGVGKKSLAREIHRSSGRGGQLRSLICAGVSEKIAEIAALASQLASGGTLLLDEVAQLPGPAQAHLLEAIRSAQAAMTRDVSAASTGLGLVIASTLAFAALAAKKHLREDLMAALSGLEMQVPALAQRRADIAPLFARLLEQFGGGRSVAVEAALVEALCLYDWPMNVHELQVVTRGLLAIHGGEGLLERAHLPARLLARGTSPTPAPPVPADKREPPAASSFVPMRERRHRDLARIEQELASNGGNIKATAEALGISRQRVYRLLEARAELGQNGPVKGGARTDAPRS